MKLTIGIIAVLITIVTVNCTSTENKNVQPELRVENKHDIRLNGKKKWLVDPEMMVSIRKMEAEINSFDGTSMIEYNNHAKTISELIGALTSNCTMEGEAHDELHKWLLPFIDLNDELLESTTVKNSASIVENQRNEIQVFNTFFN